jgi:RNA polymerase sigma-70 factor, ECF subfamily
MSNDERIEREDRELIRRMASKDSHALEIFYERYNRIAFSLVLRIVRVREDAEDVLLEVFWQAWQQAPRYDASRGKPMAWLLTIARTRAIDCIRSSGRRPAGTSDSAEEMDQRQSLRQAAEPDPFIVAGTRSAVTKCLESLNRDQRIPLEMAYFEGMTHSEIAGALNQPLGTMKDRIRTGMMHLRKCLKPFEARA